MIKYWSRLTTLPKSRLVSHCYWSLYSMKNVKDTWLTSIKESIRSTGQYNFNFLWNSQNALHQVDQNVIAKCLRNIKKTLKHQFLTTAVEKMNEQSKLRFFRDAKSEFTTSNYLSTLVTRDSRSIFCKLRLGVLKLEVETCRKNGLDHSLRKCRLCNSGEVEDELHFLFSCHALSRTREIYLNPLFNACNELSTASHLDKLFYLFFNENLSSEELSLA